MTYTTEELGEIIAKHKKWYFNEKGGQRADLRGADLRGSYLRGSYLRDAYLRDADLQGADLRDVGGREVNTILSVSGIGSARRTTTYWVEENTVWCGYFKGTMEEFEAKVQETHGDTKHGQDYLAAIAFFKVASPVVEKESGE